MDIIPPITTLYQTKPIHPVRMELIIFMFGPLNYPCACQVSRNSFRKEMVGSEENVTEMVYSCGVFGKIV
jgi:hypothetical protein